MSIYKSNSKTKKCILIFSGYNQRAIISFIRTLLKNNVEFAIIAASEKDEIFLTDFSSKVLAIRQEIQLELQDILSSIKKVHSSIQADEYLIAPTTEALNRFLIKYRTELQSIKCEVPLVDKKIYELISDKYSFGNLCKDNNILVPKEINIHRPFTYPIVAKPKTYGSINSNRALYPVIIKDELDLEMFIKANNMNMEDFYFQEYVKGRSFYLLYYFHRNGSVYKYSQENLIQQPEGKSIIAAISSTIHLEEESKKYEQMFKDVNYFGLVMVEVKKNSNHFYMIEANPRFWGPSQLFVDANVNLFEQVLEDFGIFQDNLNSNDRQVRNSEKYFWFGGFLKTIKEKKEVVFHVENKYEILLNLHEWIEKDIYKRKDTIGIFLKETQK